MKLSELCGTHVGKNVTITTGDGSLSGTLFAVEHVAEKISSTPFGRGVETFDVGRYSVRVEVGASTAKDLDPLFDCEVGA